MLVLNGYGRFDITDLTFHIGEGGNSGPRATSRARCPQVRSIPEVLYARGGRHGGESREDPGPRRQPIYPVSRS